MAVQNTDVCHEGGCRPRPAPVTPRNEALDQVTLLTLTQAVQQMALNQAMDRNCVAAAASSLTCGVQQINAMSAAALFANDQNGLAAILARLLQTTTPAKT